MSHCLDGKKKQHTLFQFLGGTLASLSPVLDVLEAGLLVLIDELQVRVHAGDPCNVEFWGIISEH